MTRNPQEDGLKPRLNAQSAQLAQRFVQQRAIGGCVEPAAYAARVRQRQVPPAGNPKGSSDDLHQRSPTEERLDGHLADQQHYLRLDQLELSVEALPAQGD